MSCWRHFAFYCIAPIPIPSPATVFFIFATQREVNIYEAFNIHLCFFFVLAFCISSKLIRSLLCYGDHIITLIYPNLWYNWTNYGYDNNDLFSPNHIILNPQVCMMCDHFRQSAEWTFALDNLNLGWVLLKLLYPVIPCYILSYLVISLQPRPRLSSNIFS